MRLTTMQWLVAAVAAGAIHHSSAIAQTPSEQEDARARAPRLCPSQPRGSERKRETHGLGTHVGSHVLGRLGIQGGGR
jgi:hypothetical protein